MGFSLVGNHSHCLFPDVQVPQLTAFIDKYLRGKPVSTKGIQMSNFTVDLAEWVTGPYPDLK
jgi:hypothetical protein